MNNNPSYSLIAAEYSQLKQAAQSRSRNLNNLLAGGLVLVFAFLLLTQFNFLKSQVNASYPISAPISTAVTETPNPTPTATPIATPTQSQTSSSNSGGSNSSSGGSSVNNTCTDAKPGNISLLSAKATGLNQVTLTWTKAADPITHYVISYGTNTLANQYGSPKVGDKNTTQYVVKSLSSGKIYYFRVLPVNNCTPGSFSNVVSNRPTGKILNTQAQRFSQNILSTATKSADIKPSKPVSGGSNILTGISNFFKSIFK